MKYPIPSTAKPPADQAAARVGGVCQDLRGSLFNVTSVTSTR